MRTRLVRIVAAVLILTAAREARADWLWAITSDNQLQLRQISAPGQVLASIPVTGLLPGTSLVAIDIRPLDQQIYALGIVPGSPNDIRLYRLHPTTGAATLISQAPLAITNVGTDQGFDFNPATDQIRVVGSNEINFRISPSTGAVVDGDPGTPGIQPDSVLSGATHVVALAYSNNFVGTAGSTAYGIDVNSDNLVRIGGPGGTPSPNLGVVTVINSLGFDAATIAGLDIVTPGNRFYALLREPNADVQLARIDVDTSTNFVATLPIGLIDAPGLATVRDIAVQSFPVTAYALFQDGHLVQFKTNFPGTLIHQVTIGGLASQSESVEAIEWRQQAGTLYALTNAQNLYEINRFTGEGISQKSIFATVTGTHRAVAIDPVQDFLRYATETGEHRRYRFEPPEGDFAPAAALLAENINGIAYSSNPIDPTRLTLYGISTLVNTLITIGGPGGTPSPDGADITPVGSLGIDVPAPIGFDITDASNTAYFAARVGGIDQLYITDLVTGFSTLVGPIGSGALGYGPVKGLALESPGLVGLTGASSSVPEASGFANVEVIRVNGSEGPFSVDYSVIPDGAEPGVDYQPVSGTLVFLDGETSKLIQVPIVNDTEPETTIERFFVRLANATHGMRILGEGQLFMQIVDDEFVNTPPTITILSPTAEPTYTANTTSFDLAGTASDDSRIVSITWEDTRGNSGTAQGIGNWIIPGLRPDGGMPVTFAVRARDETGAVSIDRIDVSFTDFKFMFAEGATGSFFDLDILLTNTEGIPADATLMFLREDGTTLTHTQTLAPMSRTTIKVDEIPGMESTAASTVVSSSRPLIAERTMRWGGAAGAYGAHTEKAVDGPAQKWYFAEGSQGFFSTYLLLANPNSVANTATVEYLREGASPVTRTYPLAPLSRLTVDAGADPELVNTSFGMVVTFAQPAVAERSMYFGSNPLWKGGHESAGATFPAETWFLAEGATGPFFETFILLANPQTTAAQVTVKYLLQDAPAIEKTYTVAASSRLTINIEAEDPALANVAVGTQIVSSVPIVVERAQYWPFSPDQWYEAHNAFGVIATDLTWGLAEGRVGGPDAYETYVLLANPGTTQADVTIRFFRTTGVPLEKTFVVPPASRLNIATGPGGPIPELSNEEFSAVIASSIPIVVERAMYSTVSGLIWSAGTNATATRFRPPP